MRDLGQNVPHGVDLAPLPARPHELFLDRSLDARVGIGDAQAGLPRASAL